MTATTRAITPAPRDLWRDISLNRVPPLGCADAFAGALRMSALGSRAATGPLLDLEPVCAVAGVDVRRLNGAARRTGVEASLLPERGDRFSLLVDPEPPTGWGVVPRSHREDLRRQRERFRIAHEIGHTLFYARAANRTPKRLVGAADRQERWCDAFARALLLPTSDLVATRLTPRSILAMQRRFDISLHVAVRGAAEIHAGAFVALLVRRGKQQPYLRVQWCSSPRRPSPRWWAATWLQQTLDRVPLAGRDDIALQGHSREVAWLALRDRQQVLLAG